jgi:FAD/FMN-containing dehydrogenase
MIETVQEEFTNWSGSLHFKPAHVAKPQNERQLAELVRRAHESGHVVRPAGAGHSSMPLMETEDVLVSMEHFKGLVRHDPDRRHATIRTGMTLGEAGKAFSDVGLAMHNLGDVNLQTVVGAISTGTHGTGRQLQRLSAPLVKVRMITASGEIAEFSEENEPDVLRACRASLGTLGIFTEITLRLLPAYRLRRREMCAHIEDCIEHFEELAEGNRHFDFYWYPRSDLARLRILNPPEKGIDPAPYARLDKDWEGWSHEIIPRDRQLKFDEMEYALPAAAGIKCFQEVRQRIKQRHRRDICWRVLYRTVAADDVFMSSAYHRDIATISLHHNAGQPFWDYFRDIEPIFRSYGGVPHWAKKHTLSARDVAPFYPMWDRFLEIRRQMDPDGVFLNPFLRQLLGVE